MYLVVNRIWKWGLGWLTVDDNLIIFVIAVEAAML
jgi:hypothetical protein